MATEFHLRVQRVLERAAAAPAAAREATLCAACADDTRLLREARALLPHYLVADELAPRRPTALGTSLPGTTTLVRLRADGCAAAADDTEPRPPFSLESYTVVQVIGRGGMGVVYRAIQPVHGREVAIKILRHRLRSAADHYRFAFECEILRQLRHPGIARFSHSGLATLRPRVGGAPLAAQPYFVMEYVHGQPLTWYAAAHRLSGAERLALLLPVCEAMDYAHQRGVVHCDLKPDNILVDAAGRPRIVDFGIARFAAEGPGGATTGAVGGTRAYASPEQVLGRVDEIGPASDVYALGIVAHELLAGGRPRRRGWALELDLGGASWRPDATVNLQRAFAHRLHHALATALRQPGARWFATAGALGAALRQVAEEMQAVERGERGPLRKPGAAAQAPASPLQGPLRAVLRSRVRMRLPPPGRPEG